MGICGAVSSASITCLADGAHGADQALGQPLTRQTYFTGPFAQRYIYLVPGAEIFG
jgi:hypothetical protein